MSPYSVVFCGTPDFAVASLQALLDDPNFTVTLVITQPDKPLGRGQKMTAPPVKTVAVDCGIEVIQPIDINQCTLPEHDFLVVVAYGQLLQQSLLDAPTIAPVNVHASLLPAWRGAAPMQASILHGDPTTGVTIQRLVKDLDAGPILAQQEVPLAPRITISSLHDELADLGATLLVNTLREPLRETPQDHAQASYCRKLSRTTGNVDPSRMTAEEIDRHVRALVPWPGVRCSIDDTEVKLLETSLEPTTESLALPCHQSTLHIVTVQSPGKRPMSGAAWHRGR